MPLDTHTSQQKKPKTSTTFIDSDQAIIIQEQTPHSTPENLESQTQSNNRKQSTQKVEETLNVQHSEPTLQESVSMPKSPETDIVEKVEKITVQDEMVGVKVPLDLGTPSIVPEEVENHNLHNVHYFHFYFL